MSKYKRKLPDHLRPTKSKKKKDKLFKDSELQTLPLVSTTSWDEIEGAVEAFDKANPMNWDEAMQFSICETTLWDEIEGL